MIWWWWFVCVCVCVCVCVYVCVGGSDLGRELYRLPRARTPVGVWGWGRGESGVQEAAMAAKWRGTEGSTFIGVSGAL